MTFANELMISSPQNPIIKEVLSLREKRERDATGKFLIEGFREITRALDGKVAITELLICPELFLGENERALILEAKKKKAKIVVCTQRLFEKISSRSPRWAACYCVSNEIHSERP